MTFQEQIQNAIKQYENERNQLSGLLSYPEQGKFNVDQEHQYQGFTPGDDVTNFQQHGGTLPTMQEATTTPTGNPYNIPDEIVQGTGNVGSGAFVTPGYHDVVDFEEQGGLTAGINKDNQGAGGLNLQRKSSFKEGPGYDRWQRAIDRAGQGKVILDPKYRQLLKKHYKETGEYGGHGRPMLKDYKFGSGDWMRAMQDWRSTQLRNPAMQEALDEHGLGNRDKEDLYLGEEGMEANQVGTMNENDAEYWANVSKLALKNKGGGGNY
jgi:hypothetical protein